MFFLKKRNFIFLLHSMIFIVMYFFVYNFCQFNSFEDNIKFLNNLLVIQLFSFIFFKFYIEGVNGFFLKTYNTFFLIFSVFHLGIGISEFFGYSNEYFDQQLVKWYISEDTLYSLYSIAIFTTTYIFFGSFDFHYKTKNKPSYSSLVYKINNYFLVFLSFFWILVVYFIVGINSYQEIYSTENDIFYIIFVYGTAIINISFLFTLLDPKRNTYPLVVFFIWGLAAFSIGIRGPVFYQCALTVAILISQGRIHLNYTKLSIVSVLFFSMLAYKFLERNDLDVDNLFNPLSSIREMGGSLRPVREAHLWIKDGMSIFYGETYLAPIDRLFNKIFHLKEVLPGNMDERLMNVMIMNKAGPYGFSIVAEAYVNLKNYGVLLVSFLSVLLFKIVDSKIENKTIGVFSLIIAYLFFYHIRQAFVSAFGVTLFSILYTFTLFFIAWFLGKIVLKRRYNI